MPRDICCQGTGTWQRSATIRTLDNSMKVTVLVKQMATTKRLMVTAQDHIVCTASGNLVRIANN